MTEFTKNWDAVLDKNVEKAAKLFEVNPEHVREGYRSLDDIEAAKRAEELKKSENKNS